MSIVEFKFERISKAQPSGFDLGRLGIKVGNVDVLDADPQKDQRVMMIYVSIVNLIDGLCSLIESPAEKSFEFVGVGSSIAVKFQITRGRQMKIVYAGKRVIELEVSAVFQALKTGVSDFLSTSENALPSKDPVFNDLQSSRFELASIAERLVSIG